jgi:hypothetical protein
MKNYLYSTLITLLVLFSCSPKEHFVIMPGYENQKFKEVSFSIVLLNKPNIQNSSTLIESFDKEGIPEKLYIDFFSSKFPQLIKKYTYFSEVLYDTSVFITKREILGFNEKEKIDILVPELNEPIVTNGIKMDFILFIHDLTTTSLSGQHGDGFSYGIIGGAISGGGGRFASLAHFGKYLIWDNHKSKILTYGRINAEVAVGKWDEKAWIDGLKQTIIHTFNRNIFKTKRNFSGNKW